MNRNRLLIITNVYSPMISARVFRWSAIAEHWAKEGHQVDVLCARHDDLPAEEEICGVRVHRVSAGPARRLRRLIARPGGTAAGLSAAEMAGDASGLARRLVSAARGSITWTYDCTWKKLWWPDFAALWYFAAARTARKLVARHKYDTLITSSHPFVDHLIGLHVKRKFIDLPWVVDVGDPFCFLEDTPPNNRALYRRLNYWADKKVFEAADGISVTCEPTKRIYAGLFPTTADRIRVIPPLLRTTTNSAAAQSVFPDDDQIRLVFVGQLHEHIREPRPVLRTFQRLLETGLKDRLELHFFGLLQRVDHLFDSYRSLLGKQLFLHGRVDHDTAQEAMAGADVLVNIGNRTTYQLPSKVVEYAQAGVPVLNFASLAEDTSARFFADHPAALSVFGDGENMDVGQWERLLRFVERPPRVDPRVLNEWLDGFRTPSITSAYESLVDESNARARRAGRVPRPHIKSIRSTTSVCHVPCDERPSRRA